MLDAAEGVYSCRSSSGNSYKVSSKEVYSQQQQQRRKLRRGPPETISVMCGKEERENVWLARGFYFSFLSETALLLDIRYRLATGHSYAHTLRYMGLELLVCSLLVLLLL